MIRVTFYRDRKGAYAGFEAIGHAGYAQAGEDIVCAGASALVMNAINSVERLTGDRFDMKAREETGFLSLRIQGEASHEAKLLMESLNLGLRGIQDFYGKEYISLKYKEV